MDLLQNYRSLVAKVDEHCTRVGREFGEHLACRPGCADCCRHLSLFWVEGVALAAALAELPPEKIALIRERARGASAEGPCPLMDKGLCLLYAARPVICRTHGLPILTAQGESKLVDFCPLNFRHLSSLPGSAVMDLDRLNATIASINSLFIAGFFAGQKPANARLTMAEALLLDLRPHGAEENGG